MTDDEDNEKPVTLADYIPPTPKPDPRHRKTTNRDRRRLEEIERAVRETQPDAVRNSKRKRKSGNKPRRPDNSRRKGGTGKLIFWAIVIMLVVAFVLD